MYLRKNLLPTFKDCEWDVWTSTSDLDIMDHLEFRLDHELNVN